MNDLFVVSIVAILFLTYKLIMVLKNKEVPKGNRRIAWSLYGVCVVGLVMVNVFFT
ncbi:hypothetical protein [Sutcliffiella deserti]|uniref:hypothetical protein n=1 Tax=Sutcliffiella deserti TaxID=2875501 RepID=UPI001CBFEA21|nr:hypothetical protein [Sutcliffiella deserti]